MKPCSLKCLRSIFSIQQHPISSQPCTTHQHISRHMLYDYWESWWWWSHIPGVPLLLWLKISAFSVLPDCPLGLSGFLWPNCLLPQVISLFPLLETPARLLNHRSWAFYSPFSSVPHLSSTSSYNFSRCNFSATPSEKKKNQDQKKLSFPTFQLLFVSQVTPLPPVVFPVAHPFSQPFFETEYRKKKNVKNRIFPLEAKGGGVSADTAAIKIFFFWWCCLEKKIHSIFPCCILYDTGNQIFHSAYPYV